MVAILVASLLLTAEPTTASPPSGPVIDALRWERRPSGADVARVYPRQASAMRGAARVVMSCRVKADGSMELCVVVSEEPKGLGFGEAALKLAPEFVMSKTTASGQSVGGAVVRIPMIFGGPR